MIEYSVLITIVAACVFAVAFGVAAWTNGTLSAFKDAMLGAPTNPPAATSTAGTGGVGTAASTSARTARGDGKGKGNGNGDSNGSGAGGPK